MNSFIRSILPDPLPGNVNGMVNALREIMQSLALLGLWRAKFFEHAAFYGGTSLRILYGSDRFSEDLDFDCKDLGKEEFMEMTDGVLRFLQLNGLKVKVKDHESNRLSAFRRSYYFPAFLFDMGMTGHREERFMLKIESEDQLFHYDPVLVNIKGCGFFFPIPVPPDNILCSMKITAMLNRQKGRDFYDVMFLLGQTKPDYSFLSKRAGISELSELKSATEKVLGKVDLNKKSRDFEHLLFDKSRSRMILRVGEFIKEL